MSLLSDLVVKGGIQTGPFGSQLHAEDYTPNGVGVVMPQDIGDNEVVQSRIARIPEPMAQQLERHRLIPGDIVYSRRGDVTRRAFIRESDSQLLCGTGCLRVRIDPQKADARCVAYALGTPAAKEWLRRHAVGATMPNLNTSILGSLPLSLPEKGEQEAIAEVLGALDDKIAANRRSLAVAGELVRNLYVRLRHSAPLVALADIATNHREQVSGRELRLTETYVGLEHLDSRHLWLERSGHGGHVTSAKHAFSAGDTLFGKLRPYFHKVVLARNDGVASTDILVLRPHDPCWRSLVAAAGSSDEVVAQAVSHSNGTKMPRASWSDISSCPVPDPDASETAQFIDWMEPIVQRCWTGVEENVRLAATRDELLPLLMSGRITVRDAERRVEDEV